MSPLRFRSFVFLVSLLSTLSASGWFWLTLREPCLPSEWVFQFVVLLGACGALSLLLLFLGRSWKSAAMIIAFKFVPLVIIAIPEAVDLGIMIPLVISYVLEITYYLPVPGNRISVLAVLGCSAALLCPVRAWGIDLPRPTAAVLISLFVSGGIVGLLADRHRHWMTRSIGQQARITRLDDAIGQLTTANMGFQKYADTIQEKSTSEERNRITREIHDTVGYTLINIMMMMQDASLMATGQPEVKRLLDTARDQAQTGLNETRRALRLLRQTETRTIQTIDEVKRLVTAFQSSTGVHVKVEFGNLPFALEDRLTDFIVHMLQEGMANALRHGKATRIHVVFWVSEMELIVSIHDNGRGSGPVHEGIGLLGMRERISDLSGALYAGGVPDGFQVTARIPRRGVRQTV